MSQHRIPPEPPASDQRRGSDRRFRPTPLFSRFTLIGRRIALRRNADLLRGRYIDRAAGGYLALILVLLVLIVLDAASTLYISRNGGTEVNPIMDHALRRGVGWFLAIKLAPLPLAFLLLSIHRYFHWVRTVLTTLVLIYSGLALYHVSLLLKIH